MSQLDINNYISQSVAANAFNRVARPTLQPNIHHTHRSPLSEAQQWLRLGVMYWRRGNLDRSEHLLAKARAVTGGKQDARFLAQCFIGLALVNTSLNKIDEAIDAYEQAISFAPNNFHNWNALGNLYVKRNRHEQALYAFNQSIKYNPNDAFAWSGIANIYYQNGNVDEAIDAYQGVINLMSPPNSKEQEPILQRKTSESNIHFIRPWLRLAMLYTRKHQYQDAISAYQKILTFQTNNAKVWNDIGVLYIEMEAYEEAVKALSNAIDINPEYEQALSNLALVHTKQGKRQDGILHSRKSSDLMDSSAVSKFSEFYYKYNEETASVNLLRSNHNWKRNVKKINGLAKYHRVNGAANINVRRAKTGEKVMQEVFFNNSTIQRRTPSEDRSVKPNDPETNIIDPNAWNEKGNIYFNSQAYEDAITSYNKAIALNPDFGQSYNNLALIYFTRGNYSKAIPLLQKSVELLTTSHEQAIAWNSLGNAYRCIKDYENARAAYQKAADLDKKNAGMYGDAVIFEVNEKYKNADFWNDLGSFFYKNGIYDQAVSAFKEAIRLNASYGHSYSQLARVLTAQGEYKQAISFYRKSITLTSSSKEKAKIWNSLGILYRRLNDYDNALQAHQNATALSDDRSSLLNRTRLSLLSNCNAKQ